jgi:hypothetical protein
MWQAQIHAKICQKATVHLYTDNLTEEEVTGAFLKPVDDLSKRIAEIAEKTSGSLSICVLPEGPLTIPYI